MRNEIYFTTHLTECEHGFVEEIIREFCAKHGWTMLYYRKFKQGHVPMLRECKIRGNVSAIKQCLVDNMIEIDNANKKEWWTNPHTGQSKKVERWLAKDLRRMATP